MPAIKRAKRGNNMSKHEARISKASDGSYYALIVRIDRDGQENVIHGYARYLKTLAAAEKSTAKYIAKLAA